MTRSRTSHQAGPGAGSAGRSGRGGGPAQAEQGEEPRQDRHEDVRAEPLAMSLPYILVTLPFYRGRAALDKRRPGGVSCLELSGSRNKLISSPDKLRAFPDSIIRLLPMKSSDFRREREQRRRTYYREVILHAAERVILRKGYSATTMDDVAREARLSKATIYKYIPGKGALLYEILSHYFDDLRDKMDAIASGAGTAADRLRQAMRLVPDGIRVQAEPDPGPVDGQVDAEAHAGLRRGFRQAGRGHRRRPEDDRPAPRQEAGDQRRSAPGSSRTAWPPGEFRPMDTGRAADFLEAVLEGYTHARFWRGDAPASKDAADELTRFVLDGIRNPERTPKEN
ncbi:MAG: TetR/AcrR family transcriptional regulator [Marinilabiliales bacterium]|nr:TetR/AcrR family transcriptional regulator [Marinilabiliales bacterium]